MYVMVGLGFLLAFVLWATRNDWQAPPSDPMAEDRHEPERPAARLPTAPPPPPFKIVERHHASQISAKEAAEIYSQKGKMPVAAIASLHGVTPSLVSHIHNGWAWNDVTGLPVRRHHDTPDAD